MNVPINPDQVTKAVNLRVREDIRNLIDHAAQAQGRSRSDFMIDAARKAAEETLLDQTIFRLDAETFDKFNALLDAPPQPNERLRKMLRKPAPWDKVDEDKVAEKKPK